MIFAVFLLPASLHAQVAIPYLAAAGVTLSERPLGSSVGESVALRSSDPEETTRGEARHFASLQVGLPLAFEDPVGHGVFESPPLQDVFPQEPLVGHADFLHDSSRGWIAAEVMCVNPV